MSETRPPVPDLPPGQQIGLAEHSYYLESPAMSGRVRVHVFPPLPTPDREIEIEAAPGEQIRIELIADMVDPQGKELGAVLADDADPAIWQLTEDGQAVLVTVPPGEGLRAVETGWRAVRRFR